VNRPCTPTRTRRSLAILGAVLLLRGTLPIAYAADSSPPVAPRAVSVLHEVATPFGVTRNDPYFWLRDDTRSKPEVLAYLDAENAYADEVLRPMSALRSVITEELTHRVPAREVSVPFLDRGYWYYSRLEQGAEYPVLARKKASLQGKDEIILEERRRAQKDSYYSVGDWVVSPNGQFLAWTEDHVGRFQHELHVKNLRTGRVLADSVSGISANILWGGDNQTILYVLNNKELRPEFLKAHRVGQPVESDLLVFDETDATFYSMLVRTNDRKYLCLDGFSIVASEWRCASLATPTHFQVLAVREIGHMYDADHANHNWYIRTNWQAPNYRIVSTSDADVERGRDAWHEVVPVDSGSLIEGIKAFDGFLAIEERFQANKRLLLRTDNGRVREVAAEEPIFVMSLDSEQQTDSRWVRYEYESLSTPTITREVNVDTGQQRLLKAKTVVGYNPADYVTERAWVTARDGARIPISLLHKKEWKRDGTGALLQYGYGAYAYAVDARFTDYAISVVDRGLVFAMAHVRGGQEMGRAWYDQGHLLQKVNTFNDFIDVTRGLVAQGYAAKDRVAALGGSGGGTLMGAIANIAPEDYRVILAIVPFVDAVTTMLDPSIPLVTREYDEWGNPNKRAEYEYMLRWSPYDNVGHHAYPAMYVYTGLWDSQVQYYEPAKWVAKLRAAKTDNNPLVFRINMHGGHAGSAGRFQQLATRSEYLAFALWQLGYKQ
jgi:oligopeptidase B